MTAILQCRCRRRRCVLLLDVFEFFFVFKTSYIIHLTQFVQLFQSQSCLAQITQAWLAIVLRHILIGFGATLVDFVEDHTVFIRVQARQLVLVLQLYQRFRVQW